MSRSRLNAVLIMVLACCSAITATAQSFRVQCPSSTITHPDTSHLGFNANSSEPAYNGPTAFVPSANGFLSPTATTVNGAIKCQEVSGGDGYATMADGSQIYMFSFGPLSGLSDIANGQPGTEFPNIFNLPYGGTPVPGDPASTPGFNYNGAIGLAPDMDQISAGACAAPCLDGHVDARQMMDVAVMNGNIPAPLIAIDEDDELFLTLSNVGMIMRPDLFEQHTIHFHGYPNAASFFDGVPDASAAINIGGSFTYYYLAPDAGTYFWHCHISPPEHLQMGMVGQLYVRPRQDRVPIGSSLYTALQHQNSSDPRTKCDSSTDILCSTTLPLGGDSGATGGYTNGSPTKLFAYNDGDGSTQYDVEYPLQIHGFDPNFHFVGMTFNPENFATMKDKYFLLNGRSYPDTVTPGAMATQSSDQKQHYSQPLPSIINIPLGGRALLRISDLDVSEYQTLASLGIPMKVIGLNAKLLRDQAGNNMSYKTNSITLAGGESVDVILDATNTTLYPVNSTFYLYTPNLDHLSNDAENFGGLMTEVHIVSSVPAPTTVTN